MRFSNIPKLWRVVLIVSLALNLAVVGVVVGQALDRPDRDRGARVAGPAAPLIRALEAPDRAALIDQLRSQGQSRSRPRKGRGLAEIMAALRADPFDPDALRAALTDARRNGDAWIDLTETALIARLSGMTSQARAAYADRLATGFRRGK